jgi:hypothetical protein
VRDDGQIEPTTVKIDRQLKALPGALSMAIGHPGARADAFDEPDENLRRSSGST